MSFFDLVKAGSRHELGNYLRDNYKNNPAEIERRKQAKKRDDFYAGEGDEYIIGLIAATFQDPENRKMRTALVSHAKWNNVIARVVNEKASVYKLPARRRVNGEPNQARYQALLDAIAMDQLAQAIDRKLALHEDPGINADWRAACGPERHGIRLGPCAARRGRHRGRVGR